MDPATIFQIVGTAISVGDVVVKCITRLSALKAKYHDAPIHIFTMVGQLHTVQASLDQLSVWNKAENDGDPRFRQLASQIGNSVDSFGVLILALEKELDRFEEPGLSGMAAKSRVRFLWCERNLAEYSILLDRQVSALSLLLQAIQCQTWTQQQSLMDREESQSILTLAKDTSSSVFGLDDTHSFISEDTANISVMFDFDNLILASKIYQQAERSHLRQAIRARPQASPPKEEDVVHQEEGNELQVLDQRCEYLRQTYKSLRWGRQKLHIRMISYLRRGQTVIFSRESLLKQEEALAELDVAIDEFFTKLELAENRRRQILLEYYPNRRIDSEDDTNTIVDMEDEVASSVQEMVDEGAS